MSGGGRPSFSELMQPRFSIHIPERIQVRCSKMLHKCLKPNLQFFNLLKLENKSEKWNCKQIDIGQLLFFTNSNREKYFPAFFTMSFNCNKMIIFYEHENRFWPYSINLAFWLLLWVLSWLFLWGWGPIWCD